jgi:hypothetical protein
MRWELLGISQQKCLDLGLDCRDVVILKTLWDFRDSGKMKFKLIDDKTFYWVSYEGVKKWLPIIGDLGKRQIIRIFDNFIEKGLMYKFIDRDIDSKTYFNFSEKLEWLIIGDDEQKDTPDDRSCKPGVQKMSHNSYSNNDITKERKDLVETTNKEKDMKELSEKQKIISLCANLLHEKFPDFKGDCYSVSGRLLKSYPLNAVKMNLESLPVQGNVDYPLRYMLAKLRDVVKYPKQAEQSKAFLSNFAQLHKME